MYANDTLYCNTNEADEQDINSELKIICEWLSISLSTFNPLYDVMFLYLISTIINGTIFTCLMSK